MFATGGDRGGDIIMAIPGDGVSPMENTLQMPEGGFALLSTVQQNPTMVHAITSLSFDPCEELLWTGNDAGRVVSMYGAQLEKYTAFVSTNGADIRSLLATDAVILALSAQCLKANRRQGISVFTHTSESMIDLTCLHQLAASPQRLLLGGNQKKIIQFDLGTEKEIRAVTIEQKNCLSMRSNSKFLFSSDSDGNVTLHNSSSLDAIHALQAHQGPVSDFDVHGNKLITCGCSRRHHNYKGDLFLMLYDLRTLRSLPPIQLPIAPAFCRFLPSYSDSRLLVASHAGELIVMDLNEQANHLPIQLDTGAITSLDISQTRQCIAFGDQTGIIHLFSDRVDPVFNENSYETEFPDPVVLHPPLKIDDTEPPYAVFQLPFPIDDGYVSDWPYNLCVQRVRQADPIPQKTLDSMRMVQFVGYATNPRINTPLRSFNVRPYNTQEKIAVVKRNEASSIPKCYLHSEGWPEIESNESDCKRWNRTSHNAIRGHSDLLPANALLTAFYHLLPIRNVFQQHVCGMNGCVSCELNTLFRFLTDHPPPHSISIDDFVACFKAANTEEILLDLKAGTDTARCSRIFLKCLLSMEFIDPLNNQLKICYNFNNRCIRCSEQFQTSESNLHLSLIYPNNCDKHSFCTMIEKSLNFPEQKESFCEKCHKRTRISRTRRVSSLPNVLLIDTSASNADEQTFWSLQLEFGEKRPLYAHLGAKPSDVTEISCRYGDECKKPGCKYSHSVASDKGVPSDSDECESEWSHYLPNLLNVKVTDGICAVSELDLEKSVAYQLCCAIFAINDKENKKSDQHLVTAVKMKICNENEKSWFLFNNVCVSKISEHAVLHIDASWKLPVVLFYIRNEIVDNLADNRIPIHSSFVNPPEVDCQNDAVIPVDAAMVAIEAESEVMKDGKKRLCRICGVHNYDECFMNDILYERSVETGDFESTLKHANVAMKLLYLVENGVAMSGHNLTELTESLNVHVPKDQLNDLKNINIGSSATSLEHSQLIEHFCGKSAKDMDLIDKTQASFEISEKIKKEHSSS